MSASGSNDSSRFLRTVGPLAACLFALVTAVLIRTGYLGMFCSFATYDDEGYLLVTLDGFRHGAALYDDVYTSYGPAYYWIMGGVFKVLGLAVTHNAGRLVTLGAWIMTSLLSGLLTWRIVGSVALGLGAEVLVFRVLSQMTSEPMHPGVLVSIVLAAMATMTLWTPRRSTIVLTLMGVGSGILFLTKINIGIFSVAAVAFYCLGYRARGGFRKWIFHGVTGLVVLLPLALMAPSLGHRWAQVYALSTSAAAALTMWATSKFETRPTGDLRDLIAYMGGFLVSVGSIMAATFWRGTTLPAMFDGLIVVPSRHFTVVVGALEFGTPSMVISSVLMVLASAWLLHRTRGGGPGRLPPIVEAWVRVAAGLGMWITASGFISSYLRGNRFAFVFAPFAWLIAAPPADQEAGTSDFRFTWEIRRFLPLFAILQTLQAYPVPGTQVRTGSFLFIPIAAICMADGLRVLNRHWNLGRGRSKRALLAALALIFVAPLWTLIAYHWRVKAEYSANAALSFPGANRLHLPLDQRPKFEAIVASIKENCAVFTMLPGMNSFYLWAGQPPPTWLNTTTWPSLFDRSIQERVVDRLKGARDVCALQNMTLALGWMGGRPLPPGPLVKYITEEMAPLQSFGDYVLLKHPARGP